MNKGFYEMTFLFLTNILLCDILCWTDYFLQHLIRKEWKKMYTIDLQKPVHVYFIGIGGISMSGLAHILQSKGFKISGSDAKESENT